MKYFMSLLALLFTLGLPGCKKEEPAAHDHDHDSDSDHDHDKDADAPESSHGHHHVAPNGGTLVELGDHFAHLEIKVDHTQGKVTIWVLDGEASKPIRIKQDAIKAHFAPLPGPDEAAITVIYELDLKPVESKLTGEKAGDTSQFTATHDQLKNLKQMKFTIESLELKGQSFKQLAFEYPKGNEG